MTSNTGGGTLPGDVRQETDGRLEDQTGHEEQEEERAHNNSTGYDTIRYDAVD